MCIRDRLTAVIDRWFGYQGWTVEGTAVEPRKFVIIAAPHTSNWDFVYFVGASKRLNLNLSFMGKKSLFRWPFGRMMREMGGIPVDRSCLLHTSDALDERVTEAGCIM